MNGTFIVQILASVFDWFKTKNPVVATVILSVLAIVVMNGQAILANFGVTNQVFVDVVKWLALALTALTGSRTSNILATADDEKKTTVQP